MGIREASRIPLPRAQTARDVRPASGFEAAQPEEEGWEREGGRGGEANVNHQTLLYGAVTGGTRTESGPDVNATHKRHCHTNTNKTQETDSAAPGSQAKEYIIFCLENVMHCYVEKLNLRALQEK